MSPRTSFPALAALAAVLACSDRTSPDPASDHPATPPAARRISGPGPATARERLARQVAAALADSGFRAQIRQAIEGSRVREHKVHLQRFLAADHGRRITAMARLSGGTEAAVEADALASAALELYLPVPAHRQAWRGGEHILVATAGADHEAPIAFTPQGQRLVLDPEQPPATPVLAVVPAETDFTHLVAPQNLASGGSPPPPSSMPRGLYMTYAHFTDDYEGWLKGAPEFEIHVLGQAGATDSLQSYSCAGERAGGYYYYNQDKLDWVGGALLMTDAQLGNYKANHPNQNFRIFVVEDDDTACQIKVDPARFRNLVQSVEAAYPLLTGGHDTTSSTLTRLWKRANAIQRILKALGSFLNSNDEMVGNAVEASVTGVAYPNANWVVKADGNKTTGWLKLVMQ